MVAGGVSFGARGRALQRGRHQWLHDRGRPRATRRGRAGWDERDVEGDAAAVKTHCQADGEIVWRNCRLARERGVWIELTTLVIPGVNDAAETLQGIAERTVAKLGRDTPWHASRDYPARCYAAPPTAVATLARARQIGRPAGLRYVYPGNVAGHPAEQTTCPDCGMMLVERSSLSLLRCDVTTQGRCPHCGVEIAGVGWRSADGLAN